MSAPPKVIFKNAKTGKRTWPTDADPKDPVMERLDELQDMLEEVLAILGDQDTEDGTNLTLYPATLAMQYAYKLNCAIHRIHSCLEICTEINTCNSLNTLCNFSQE